MRRNEPGSFARDAGDAGLKTGAPSEVPIALATGRIAPGLGFRFRGRIPD